MAGLKISEIVTTTIENRRRKLADNVSDNTSLLNRLKARGKQSPIDGGRTIFEELEYAENQTYKRYSGYEVLNIQPSDVMTAAEFDLREVACAITISRLEELQNSGREQMISLVTKRVENAERTMTNGLSGDLYSDGEADSGKQIDGLGAVLPDAMNSGTYGGIDRAQHEFWRHQRATGIAKANNGVRDAMMAMFIKLCRNMDKPDLIPSGDEFYQAYWAALQDQQRFQNAKMAQMGYVNLKFHTADMVLDGGLGGSAAAKDAYMLNTNYLFWRPHRDQNMTPSDDRYAVNQTAMVRFILWAGNLTCSNLSLQGRLTLQ